MKCGQSNGSYSRDSGCLHDAGFGSATAAAGTAYSLCSPCRSLPAAAAAAACLCAGHPAAAAAVWASAAPVPPPCSRAKGQPLALFAAPLLAWLLLPLFLHVSYRYLPVKKSSRRRSHCRARLPALSSLAACGTRGRGDRWHIAACTLIWPPEHHATVAAAQSFASAGSTGSAAEPVWLVPAWPSALLPLTFCFSRAGSERPIKNSVASTAADTPASTKRRGHGMAAACCLLPPLAAAACSGSTGLTTLGPAAPRASAREDARDARGGALGACRRLGEGV